MSDVACVVRMPAQKTAVEHDSPADTGRNDHCQKIPAAGRRPTPEAAVGAMLAYVEACLVPGARP